MKSTGMRGNLKSRPDLGAKGYEKRGQHQIILMPSLAHLRLYDNSTQFDIGHAIGDPILVLEMRAAKRLHPATLIGAENTPEWAKPAVEVAFELDPDR